METLGKQILHDNVVSWEILGRTQACGIILEDSLATIQSACLDANFFPQALRAISSQDKELLARLMPPSVLHLFLIGRISGLLDRTSLIASALLQRKLFSFDLTSLRKLYTFHLTEFGLSPQQVQEIVQRELNAEPLAAMEGEIASIEAQAPTSDTPSNLKIEFYKRLVRELSAGNELMKSVEIAAGSNKEWCDLFAHLNQGEESLQAQMQTSGHTFLEQLFVMKGLQSGSLDLHLESLVRAMTTLDRLRALNIPG